MSANDHLFQGERLTPEKMLEMAEWTADKVLRIPEADKKQFMQELKEANPVLWALTKSKLETVREMVRTRKEMAPWLKKLLADLFPDQYPKPEDNLGWGI